MDYLCAEFGDFIFSRFGFIVQTDRQNHKRLINAILTRLPRLGIVYITVHDVCDCNK